MNIEEKLAQDVEIRFEEPWATNIYINGEHIKHLASIGIFHDIRNESPMLVLEYCPKGAPGQKSLGRGRVEIPIRGIFKGKGLGGET